ncbi:unnamed protein product [Durusdinium trenchii]|uniref:Uncharacterized protein n=1 Tax=Durusdinium trenchii TaxID=1381693 RepID=A0ABP0MFF6_9DINO
MDFVPNSTRSQYDDVPGFSDEEWPQQRMYGDFYREKEDNTRGVSFAPEPVGRIDGLTNSKDTVSSTTNIIARALQYDCDYYREQDDVLKGLTIAQLPEESMFGNRTPWSWGSSTCASSEEHFFKNAGACISPKSSEAHGNTATRLFDPAAVGGREFTESDVPPKKPMDPYWQFEVTTAYVQTATPWTLGNHLLNFLMQDLASPNIKVGKPGKFAIKADAFVGSVKCTLKIRVYSEENEKYAVEFQRRMGCSVAFNRAFSEAVKFLRSFFTVQSTHEAMPNFSPPVCESPTSSDAEIMPLLDMASLGTFPSLQAESAAALADMAKDPAAATLLLKEDVFKEIQNLLQSNNAEVAFPTSRLLSSLAKIPQASNYFSAPGLLPMMIDKVQSPAYAQLVELAQAVTLVIERVSLDEEQKERVTRQLQLAIKEMVPSHRARPLLEQALHTLRRRLA